MFWVILICLEFILNVVDLRLMIEERLKDLKLMIDF